MFVYVHMNAELCALVSLPNMDTMSIVSTCPYRMTMACKTFKLRAKFAFIDTTNSVGVNRLAACSFWT